MIETYRIITAILKAHTSIHIGSGEGNDMTDDLIRRSAQGIPIIPGTAIAGALRSLLTRLGPRLGTRECHALTDEDASCDCGVCRLFGDVNPSDEEASQSAASRLLVFDARLIRNDQTVAKRSGGTIRDGVGIERASGVAARQGSVKFDLEILPPGTEFQLRMELRGANAEDEQLLAAGLAEWEHGRMWLGGRVARGLGAFDLGALKFVELDLSDASQLMTFLKEGEPWHSAREVTARLCDRIGEARGRVTDEYDKNKAIARCWAKATFTLQVDGLFLTNDAVSSAVSGFDHAPLLANAENWQHPILSGAGLRGVLRAQGERIARTLATLKADNLERFKAICPACDPNAKGNRNQRVELESCDTLLLYSKKIPGDKEVEAKQLCMACRLFGSTRLGSRLIVEDAPLIGEPHYKMLDFVAIDRFTGGGSEGLKFDALALWQPAFRIQLFLDNPAEWELGWLTLILRDIWEGQVPIGFGEAKGFGKVKIVSTNWQLRLGFLTESDFPKGSNGQDTLLSNNQTYDGVYRYAECRGGDLANRQDWLAIAEAWIKQFHAELNECPRWNELPLPKDSYFEHEKLMKLYPKQVPIR